MSPEPIMTIVAHHHKSRGAVRVDFSPHPLTPTTFSLLKYCKIMLDYVSKETPFFTLSEHSGARERYISVQGSHLLLLVAAVAHLSSKKFRVA